MGTPSITTRGMKVREMQMIAKWIIQVMNIIKNEQLPEGNVAKKRKYINNLAKRLNKNAEMIKIRSAVRRLCREFPAPDSFV